MESVTWREILVTGGPADDLILDVVRPVHETGATRPAFFWRDPPRQGGGVRYRVPDAGEVAGRLGRAAGSWPGVVVAAVPPGAELIDIGDVLGGARAEPMIAGFLSEAAELVFGMLQAVRDRTGDRATMAFDLMVATMVAINRQLFASVAGYRYPTSFICFRSSADGFLIQGGDPERSRARLDAVYAARAPAFRERLAAVVAQCREDGPVVSGIAADWTARLGRSISEMRAEVSGGGIVAPTGPAGYLGDGFDLGPSTFHQLIQNSSGFQDFMRTDGDFRTMRVTLTLLCAVLHQAGIRLVDRYALSHCLACAAEEVFEVSATEVLEGLPEMSAG